MGSKDVMILIASVLMWLFMGVCSGYCLFEEFKNYIEFTRIILLIYLFFFAVLGLAFEARIGVVRNYFTFLSTSGGKGIFLIFLGTLGISFGFTTSPLYKFLPSVVGIASFCVAILIMILGCTNREKKSADATAELPAVSSNA